MPAKYQYLLTDFKEERIGDFAIIKETPINHKLLEYHNIYKDTIIKSWMTDYESDRKEHEFLLKDFHGNIAIGGLGLGLFFYYIPRYTKIDVFEKSKDVIDLVWKYYKEMPNVFIHNVGLDNYKTYEPYDFLYVDYHIDSCYEKISKDIKYNIKNNFINTSKIVYWELEYGYNINL